MHSDFLPIAAIEGHFRRYVAAVDRSRAAGEALAAAQAEAHQIEDELTALGDQLTHLLCACPATAPSRHEDFGKVIILDGRALFVARVGPGGAPALTLLDVIDLGAK
jgi:hypothetical protein